MSQNDFVIDDSTGDVVLNDINSALQALASNSKEQNAPSTSYPSQFFANESSGKLSYRDGSDPGTYYNLANLDGGLFVDQTSTFNGDVIFKGTNGTTDITFDPSLVTGNGGFKFKDFATIRLGTDDDFVIQHLHGVNTFVSLTDKHTIMITRTPGGTQACYTLQTQDSSGTDNAYQAFVNGHQELHFNGTEKFRTSASGITVTGSVTTQDINMSNLNSLPNEVDNTQGSWSIQEGSDDLFLINRINGKKYKFNLTEVS